MTGIDISTYVRVEGNITIPPLPSETVLATFTAHGYSTCVLFVITGLPCFMTFIKRNIIYPLPINFFPKLE